MSKTMVIQTRLGEFMVFKTDDADPLDDTNDAFLNVEFPAVMIPQQNQQLGFQMAFPFSDLEKPMSIRKSSIDKCSEANDQIMKAYEGWVTQVKSQLSGIIVPNAQVTAPGDLRAV